MTRVQAGIVRRRATASGAALCPGWARLGWILLLLPFLIIGCGLPRQAAETLATFKSGKVVAHRSGLRLTAPSNASILVSESANGEGTEGVDVPSALVDKDVLERAWLTNASGRQAANNIYIFGFKTGNDVLLRKILRWKQIGASSDGTVQVRWEARRPVSSIAVVTRLRGMPIGVFGDFAVHVASREAAYRHLQRAWRLLSIGGVALPPLEAAAPH